MARALFVTPDITSGVTQCRTLAIPANKEWLGVINKALLLLLDEYNWEQINDTDLTVSQTIAISQAMIDNFWLTDVCCEIDACLMPGGERVIRLGATGHYEQLANGGWIAPTGDYAVPAISARAEATQAERLCAAATNAMYTLKSVYEEVSDLIAAEATQTEIVAGFVIALTTYLGGWIALPVLALVSALAALIIAFVEIARFIGADLWSDSFDDILMCKLLACASESANVVSFDFECVNTSLVTTEGISFNEAIVQVRLLGQIGFMLSIIGADGLNTAGATTTIVAPTCDCDGEWTACFDFTINMQSWIAAPCYPAVWSAAGIGRISNGMVGIRINMPSTTVVSFGFEIDIPLTGNYKRLFWAQNGQVCSGQGSNVSIGSAVEWGIFGLTGETTSIEIVLQNNTPNTSNPLDYHIIRAVINGTGANPFSIYEDCPP